MLGPVTGLGTSALVCPPGRRLSAELQGCGQRGLLLNGRADFLIGDGWDFSESGS
jgi:hypothetical protein